jgi:hypothetical protein
MDRFYETEVDLQSNSPGSDIVTLNQRVAALERSVRGSSVTTELRSASIVAPNCSLPKRPLRLSTHTSESTTMAFTASCKWPSVKPFVEDELMCSDQRKENEYTEEYNGKFLSQSIYAPSPKGFSTRLVSQVGRFLRNMHWPTEVPGIPASMLKDILYEFGYHAIMLSHRIGVQDVRTMDCLTTHHAENLGKHVPKTFNINNRAGIMPLPSFSHAVLLCKLQTLAEEAPLQDYQQLSVADFQSLFTMLISLPSFFSACGAISAI